MLRKQLRAFHSCAIVFSTSALNHYIRSRLMARRKLAITFITFAFFLFSRSRLCVARFGVRIFRNHGWINSCNQLNELENTAIGAAVNATSNGWPLKQSFLQIQKTFNEMASVASSLRRRACLQPRLRQTRTLNLDSLTHIRVSYQRKCVQSSIL